jgi:hypothetical protein
MYGTGRGIHCHGNDPAYLPTIDSSQSLEQHNEGEIEMTIKSKSQTVSHKTVRCSGAGIATWKLVMFLVFVVTLAVLGAYSWDLHRHQGLSPKIDFGFLTGTQQESAVNNGKG